MYSDDEEDAKTIGIYTSQSEAELAIQQLREQPGFVIYKDGFHIDEYKIESHFLAGGI